MILNDLIKNKNEKELLIRLRNIIPSFEIQEFLSEVRIQNTLFVDIYSKNRITE